VVVVVF